MYIIMSAPLIFMEIMYLQLSKNTPIPYIYVPIYIIHIYILLIYNSFVFDVLMCRKRIQSLCIITIILPATMSYTYNCTCMKIQCYTGT